MSKKGMVQGFLKKASAATMAAVIIFSLTACGSGGENSQPAADESGDVNISATAEEESSEPASATEEKSGKIALIMQQGGLGDQGFNDTAYAGLTECVDKYNIEFNAVECTDTTQGDTLIRELCEGGYDMIINLEAGISANMYAVSQDYPEIYFVAVGRQLQYNPVEGFETTPDNVLESYVTLNEHSFLAGVVAAFAATDANTLIDGVAQNEGCNIGILFGAESVGFYQYGDGFRQGALFYNPDANVYIDYTVGFSDTANAQTIAENMINNMGCDVIWTCCGTAGLGGLQACKMSNAFGIGVDSDQDEVQPGFILTSAIRDNSALMEYYVGKYVEGDLAQNEPAVFNLTNGGVDITDMSVIAQYVTDEDKLKELEDLLTKCRGWIADGTIEVFDARRASVENDGERLDDWMKNSGKFVTLGELE